MVDSISHSMRSILLLTRRKEGVTLGEIMNALGETSIELWILLFAILSCLPLSGIPGYTTLTGLPIVFFGVQLCLGRKAAWLPRFVACRRLSSPRISRAIRRILPWLRKLERWLNPHFLFLMEKTWLSLYGIIFIVVGGLLTLPIPLINLPCAFILLLLAAGLVSNDGRVIIASLSLLFLAILAFLSLIFLVAHK